MSTNINGKWKMNGVTDCFGIGSIVSCKTCLKSEIEGEVLAYDARTKLLVLKSAASNHKPTLCDVNVVNLAYVSDVQMKKEVLTPVEQIPSLNINLLNTRMKNSISEKKRLLNSMSAGVSVEGQMLFMAITKTISEVAWDGPNIVVFDQVVISPPYKPDNVKSMVDGKEQAHTHVRKLVEKHVKDLLVKKNAQNSNNGNNIVASTSNTISKQ